MSIIHPAIYTYIETISRTKRNFHLFFIIIIFFFWGGGVKTIDFKNDFKSGFAFQ